jgi:hypothetical protein
VKNTRFAIPGSDVAAMWILATRIALALTERITNIPAFKSSATGETRFVTKGDYRDRGGIDVLIDVLVNKQAPALSVLTDRLKGQNRDGSTPTVLKDVEKLFAPLPVTTAIEMMKDPDSANILVSMILDEFGVSVNTYPDSPYKQVKQFLETTAQSYYGKSADKLTPQEFKDIKALPEYKEIEIAYNQKKRPGPARFKQSADLFEAGKRIYDSLGGDATKILFDMGITAIGISDKVQGLRMDKERMDLYEELVTENIQIDLGDILGSTNRDDMMKQIDKSKENARKTLVEFIDSGQI